MRLIDCTKEPLTLEEFFEPRRPAYAILSHTWEDEGEVTLEDFRQPDVSKHLQGWAKIHRTCKLALEKNLSYAWVDTCCIDKSSSAELTEAINSMFQWYRDAAICFAYLSDYDSKSSSHSLRQARWFTRGWTLQELIAPAEMQFYDSQWQSFGTRSLLDASISSITGIDLEVLSPQGQKGIRDILDSISIAKRFSWASKRTTKRREDLAYCLLGIFGVNMAMLYGEGAQAFIRLQEEIMRNSNDLSLFAWTSKISGSGTPAGKSTDPTPETFRGIFASNPGEFGNTGDIVLDSSTKFNPDFALSNKGVRIETFLWQTETDLVVMPLHCHRHPDTNHTLGIILKNQGGGVYARAQPQFLKRQPVTDFTSNVHNLFIAKRVTADVHQSLRSAHRHAFQFNITIKAACKLVETAPKDLWDPQNRMFMTKGHSNFVAFHRFHTMFPNNLDQYELVVACGCGRDDKPWVYARKSNMKRGSDDFVKAARAGDMGKVARIGASKGGLGSDRLYLGYFGHRFGVSVDSSSRHVDGQPMIFVNVKISDDFLEI